jgi:alkylation response protein AidB-like acyl-CoA dehydrogenase
VAAELLGVIRHSLDVTVDYVMQRRQFSVPVGSFQLVAHKCAEMLYQVAGRGVLRRVGGRCRPRALEGGCGYRQLRRIQRRRGCHRGRDPGERRRRVYLGGDPALVVQARAARRGVARRLPRSPGEGRRPDRRGSDDGDGAR